MASFGNMFDPSKLIKNTTNTINNTTSNAINTATSNIKKTAANALPIENTGVAKTSNTITPIEPPKPIATPGGQTMAGIEKSIVEKQASKPIEPPAPPKSPEGATAAGVGKAVEEKKIADAPKEEVKTATITDTMTDMEGNPLVKNTEGKYVPLIDPDKDDKVELDAKSDFNQIKDMMKDWMDGKVEDNVYEKALNNLITRIGLYNQAQQNALQQQIAQDPNLKGSGLAYGLLSLMGREQGLAAGDMLGRLSIQNAENLRDMQRFGITNFQTLERESYVRTKEGINTLIENGQYQSAARGLENLIKDNTGMNIVVDPIGLASRDPFTVDSLNNAWDMFDEILDPDNPEAAIDYLNENNLKQRSLC